MAEVTAILSAIAHAALGIARATAYRNWSFARAWLRAALSAS